MWPPNLVSHENALSVRVPAAPHDPSLTTEINVRFDHESGAAITWVVDAAGAEIEDSRVPNDSYFAYRQELPDARIELRDFSSIMDKCRSDSPGLP